MTGVFSREKLHIILLCEVPGNHQKIFRTYMGILSNNASIKKITYILDRLLKLNHYNYYNYVSDISFPHYFTFPGSETTSFLLSVVRVVQEHTQLIFYPILHNPHRV